MMVDMNNRICIVTGANSGIGKATTHQLVEMGAHVVMVCRSMVRGQAALEDIRAQVPDATLDLMIADLALQESIRQFVDVFKTRYNHLDVLINNAAIIPPKRTVTGDGIETQLAVNHLAPFLMTHLLLDSIKRAPAGRIITVSSNMHFIGRINFDDLQSERRYPFYGWIQYGNTKLANVLFTKELARRLKETTVTANTLNPGYYATQLQRGLPQFVHFFNRFFGKQPERSGGTSIYLATSQDVSAVSGEYFDNKRQTATSRRARDPETARRLWEVSAELTGIETMRGKTDA